MKSLTGSFRVPEREKDAMAYLRAPLRNRRGERLGRAMSINHIAEILGRSTSTVYHYVGAMKAVNNRTNKASTKAFNKSKFEAQKLTLKIQLKIYFAGIVDYITEALSLTQIPLVLLDNLVRLASENTCGSEADKPP